MIFNVFEKLNFLIILDKIEYLKLDFAASIIVNFIIHLFINMHYEILAAMFVAAFKSNAIISNIQ